MKKITAKKKFIFVKRAAAAAAALAVAAMMLLPAVSVRAEDYPPVTGSVTQFDKYFVRNTGADVPDNVKFKYAIVSADTSTDIIEDDEGVVLPGPDPDKIIVKLTEDGDDTDDNISDEGVFVVTFGKNDTAIDKEHQPESDYVKGLDEGEEYVKKTVYLDFKNVSFSSPGIYRYKITEANPDASSPDPDVSGDPRLTYDPDSDRYLDVYVVNDESSATPALSVASYVLHANKNRVTDTNAANYGKEASDYKTQGFTNEYTAYNLTISKTVTGNQGSKDKYFEFVFEILSGAEPGTELNIDYIYADAEIPLDPNAATTVTFPVSAASDDQSGDDGNNDNDGNNDSNDNNGSSDSSSNDDDNGSSDSSNDSSNDDDNGSSDSSNNDDSNGSSDSGNNDDSNGSSDNNDNNNETATAKYSQPRTVTVDEEGKVTQKLYMKHGQRITITGIPAGATYKVSESYEDYTPSGSADSGIEVESDGATAFKVVFDKDSNNQVTMSALDDSDETHSLLMKKEDGKKLSATYTNVYTHAVIDFENNKRGTVPTGVILSVAVPAVIGIIVIAAIVFLLVKNRKRHLEED